MGQWGWRQIEGSTPFSLDVKGLLVLPWVGVAPLLPGTLVNPGITWQGREGARCQTWGAAAGQGWGAALNKEFL